MRRRLAVIFGCACALMAQEAPEDRQPPGWREAHAGNSPYVIEPGTRIPLSLLNSVSSKHSAEGDRVYLETIFPILANGRVVIPPGSYVAGTVTEVKRPGRVKGRGELYLRFDSLTLPNGVTRDFRARVGSLDGSAAEELDRGEGKIKSEGNKGGDARTVGEATAAGASIGVISGSAAGRPGLGTAIGAAAGATAGMLGVLLSRGPDVVLTRGTTLEMVLDRPLSFTAEEIDFSGALLPRTGVGASVPASGGERERRSLPLPGRVGRWPY